MGVCMSLDDTVTEVNDGGKKAFSARFIEEGFLGEGKFGVVQRVHEAKDSNKTPLACKTIKKGMVVKDNVLYPPMKPEILRAEIEILRALQGKNNFCLQLHSVYETPKAILLITEFCAGGEMMEYVAKQESDLRTEDVSRISFQLLSAIGTCAKKGIIHRDLKPANVMFQSKDPKSELRLIDFGLSCMDDPTDQNSGRHTSFVGTPFFNSPEIFAKDYTQKTDIFSVGVTLYVLIAGYPADKLDRAFSILQRPRRNLKTLPDMPQDMPETYYDMLEKLLKFHPRDRSNIGEMLTHPFVTFHRDLALEEEREQAPAAQKPQVPRCHLYQSCDLPGIAHRHNLFLGYRIFERSVTTLLATMLQPAQLETLVNKMRAQLEINEILDDSTEPIDPSAEIEPQDSDSNKGTRLGHLSALPLNQVLKIVKEDLDCDEVGGKIQQLPNASNYSTFAYHIKMLADFIPPPASTTSSKASGSKSSKGLSKRASMNPLTRRPGKQANAKGEVKQVRRTQSVM